ncbi:MAG: hypothetical protein Q4A83_05975 [Bacillota bacterium]|nr:hypothetical protein [Bacillota bacterium]
MKKFAAIICMAAAVLALCACNDTTPVEGQENSKTEGTVVVESSNFTVTKLTGEDGIVKYSYEVKSRDGEIMEHALCAEQPRIAQINDDLVGIRFTANDHTFSRYYDIKNGVVSDSVKNAFWDNGELVASNDYDNGHYFLVQNIFGGEVSRTEIQCSSWQITVLATEINKDGTVLSVSYVQGDGSDAKARINTVRLPLVQETEKAA